MPRLGTLLGAFLLGMLALGGQALAAPATPTLQVTADANVEFADSAHATVTIAGGQAPITGTIKISLYGPGQPNCTGQAAERTQTVNGPGPYSDGYSVFAEGTYKWKVTYTSGDTSVNNSVTSACGVRETVVGGIVRDPTTIHATATPSAALGEPISAAAEVEGFVPFGDVTFRLYGPADTACSSTPVYSKVEPYEGSGLVTSGEHVPVAVGTYRWKVDYEGDEFNQPSTTTCGGAGLESVISAPVKTPTSVAATATASAETGQPISASASVTGDSPTGELTFRLYGPGNATCTGTPLLTDTVAVDGAGPYGSEEHTATATGTYRWTAGYGGDSRNEPSATACGQDGMSTVVSAPAATPTAIEASATEEVELGRPISATASVEGNAPTGELSFNLYGPGNATCTGEPAFTDTVEVAGEAPSTSGAFVPTAAGTYRWTVNYEGDAANQPSSTECGQAGLTSEVTAPPDPPDPDPCAQNPAAPGCSPPPPDPCQANPAAAECRPPVPPAARIAVTVKPRSKKLAKGRTATIRAKVANAGTAAASGVNACATLPTKGKRSFKLPKPCATLGSIPAGGSETAAFKVRATRKAKGGAKLTVSVSSGNAGEGSASVRLRIRSRSS